MRVLFHMGTPRCLQPFRRDLEAVFASSYLAWLVVMARNGAWFRPSRITNFHQPLAANSPHLALVA
jgi:hypothetical protein